MGAYWISTAASKASNIAEWAVYGALAVGGAIIGGVMWFFSESEPQLPPGAITGWVGCSGGGDEPPPLEESGG